MAAFKHVTKHGAAIQARTAKARSGPFNKNLQSTRTNSAGAEMAKTLSKKGKLKGPDQGVG